jgi:hypothetical protein
MGFWGRFGRICKRPKHVLYALTLYAVIGGAGCSSKSSKGDKEELEEIRSWIAITELNVYQWIRESTPDQYTRKVLQKAQENLKKTAKKSAARRTPTLAVFDTVDAQISSLQRAVQRHKPAEAKDELRHLAAQRDHVENALASKP